MCHRARMTSRPTAEPSLANRLRMRIGDPVVKLLAPLRKSSSTGVLHTIRKDGSPRTTALIVWDRDGEQLVIALYGVSYWALDLRSGRPAELDLGGRRRGVTATEIVGSDAVELWRWFAATHTSYAVRYAKASAQPDDTELARLAEGYPAFRLN
jgi:hypothetical protein